MKVIKSILLFLTLATQYNSFGQLYTEYGKDSTIDSLVQEMFATPSVQVLNVSYTGDYRDLIDEIWDIGYFNSLNSTVGLDSGIIITGGWLSAPYGLGIPSTNNPQYGKTTPGDSILDDIITPSETLGAAVLEFDFIPNGDSIKFNYVFASDEYPDQICSPDKDVFAFHISGQGINGMQNIALIPNTNIFVGNNSINDTNYVLNPIMLTWGSCESLDYPQYYVDHGDDSLLVFDGTTTVLTAKSGTVPCETYHLRFAIANGDLDIGESPAVFLEANSFNSEPLKIESKVSYGGNDTALYEGCGSAQIIFRRTYNLQQPKIYNISVTGSAQNGLDYNSLPSSITMQAGNSYDTLTIYPTSDLINDNLENIIITIGDTLCNGQYYETNIELVIHEKPEFDIQIIPDTGAFCNNVLFSAQIQGAFPPLSYNWNDGLSNTPTFNFYPSFQNTYINKEITLNVIDGCGNSVSDTTNIIFSKYPIAAYNYMPDYIDIDNPTVNFQDLSAIGVVNWLWNFDDITTTSTLQNPIYNYPDTGNYNVMLTVLNPFGCTDSVLQIIRINDTPELIYSNTFSPNNDGLNDLFKPIKVVGIETGTLKIFNKWGGLVYESNDLTEGWNGDYHKIKSSAGTYYWICTYSNVYDKEFVIKGFVTLFR
jgi:gliding motility-associated-like protein